MSSRVLYIPLFLLFMIVYESLSEGGFVGCYNDPPNIRKVVLAGFFATDECKGLCRNKYFRFAVTQTNVCICSNYLGSESSPQPCHDTCDSCSSKSSLYDVYYTEIVVPGPPRDLQIYNITNSSAAVSWKEPESYLDIKQYEIKAQILHTFSHSDMMSPKWIFSNNTFDTELNFHPGSKYSVNVCAVSKDGEGISASQIIETEIGSPDNIPSTPTILKHEGINMTVQLNPVINNNGPITAYQVIVINDDLHQVVEMDNIKSHSEAVDDGLGYYITGEVMPNDIFKNFVIGNGKRIGRYFNAPLNINGHYRVVLRAISRYNNVTKSTDSNFTDVRLGSSSLDAAFKHSELNQMPKVVFYLYLAIGIASCVLVAGILGFLIFTTKMTHRRRRRLTDMQELTLQGPIIEVENNGYIPEEEIKSGNYYQNLCKRISNIPISTLKLEPHSLGIGKFGRATGGTIKVNEQNVSVAVYAIADKKLGEYKVSMLKDLDISIRSGRNDNVINLIGICETRETLFVALEYASMNLKDLLLGSRESLPGRFTDMKELRALSIAVGIASGMKHLQSLKVYHKQLCARNIQITTDFLPKISGFGLSQYYNPNLVPDYTRWTAPETFGSPQYISQCDVWSFACVLWEICVLGGTPYGSVPNNEIPHKTVSGLRLPQLPYISDDLYELMLNCWQLNVEERPMFSDVAFELENIKHDEAVVHLNFRKYPGFQYEQFYPDLELAARTVF